MACFGSLLLTVVFSSLLVVERTAFAKRMPWVEACPCTWREPGVFWNGRSEFQDCATRATKAARGARRIGRRWARISIRVALEQPCGDPEFTRTQVCGGPQLWECQPDDRCSRFGPGGSRERWGYWGPRACSGLGRPVPFCGCDGVTYVSYC